MTTAEAFQTVNRLRKAKLLLAKLREYRYTMDHLAKFENKDWAIVAEAAGVHAPGKEVQEIVTEALRTNSEILVRTPRGEVK